MGLRHAAVVAGLALGLMSGAAKADVIRTFSASGLFDDGSTLSGSLQIDVTAGTVVSYNLSTTVPIAYKFDVVDSVQGYNSDIGSYLSYADSNVDPSIYLSIIFNSKSLVGYDGGSIYSISNPSPGGYVTAFFNDNTQTEVDLDQGTLSAVSSVPLPASAPMFGATLIAFGAVGYGVKRKKDAAAA